MTEDIIGFTGSKKESTSTRSDSSSGRTRRTNVYIKGEYGTEVFPPDTGCAHCAARATGVLVINPVEESDEEMEYKPLCTRHKNKEEKDVEYDYAEIEFKRFA